MKFSIKRNLLIFFLCSKTNLNAIEDINQSKHQQKPEVLISDYHIGTTMWQLAVLEAIGIPVEAYSKSSHRKYVVGNSLFRDDKIFSNIDVLSKEEIIHHFFMNERFRRVKHAICSFPPSYVQKLERLPEQISILLNIGHRFHINLPEDRLIEFTTRLIEMSRESRFKIASMSEYDCHYLNYYTKINPKPLPVVSMHIPKELREAAYCPRNRIVLIGPSHNENKIIGFKNNLAQLNKLSLRFAVKYGLEPYTFDFIRSLYPNDQATFENLSKHPAVLINPYSAFSISMAELYHLNIPFFVPADSLLIDNMGDVRLTPLYQSKAAVDKLEDTFPVESSGYPYSPNDPSSEAQQFWMQFMFFNKVKNAQRWTDPEDFFRKLYLGNMKTVHDDMQKENRIFFEEQLQTWNDLFRKF